MLYGAEVAVCFQINTEHINTVWAECVILNFLTCWCTKPEGLERLKYRRLAYYVFTTSRSVLYLRINIFVYIKYEKNYNIHGTMKSRQN